MSKITKELIFAYILEGLAIGLLVSTINSIGSTINDNVEEEKTKTIRTVTWMFTLLAALVSHVLAESLRHERIVGLMKNFTSKLSFRRHSGNSGNSTPINLFRKRSILQNNVQ